MHLVVEVEDPPALSRAVQGLAIRLARALNRLASRTGKVFADRFHVHVLKTLREVVNAVRYMLENFRHHLREDGTWLLRRATLPPLPTQRLASH
jgi:hypothetical protein